VDVVVVVGGERERERELGGAGFSWKVQG
jgi:hypothetical protein